MLSFCRWGNKVWMRWSNMPRGHIAGEKRTLIDLCFLLISSTCILVEVLMRNKFLWGTSLVWIWDFCKFQVGAITKLFVSRSWMTYITYIKLKTFLNGASSPPLMLPAFFFWANIYLRWDMRLVWDLNEFLLSISRKWKCVLVKGL